MGIKVPRLLNLHAACSYDSAHLCRTQQQDSFNQKFSPLFPPLAVRGNKSINVARSDHASHDQNGPKLMSRLWGGNKISIY